MNEMQRACALRLCLILLSAGMAVRSGEPLYKRTRAIIIPEIKIKEASPEDVFLALQARSRDLDPAGVGVNFVFKIANPDGGIFRRPGITMNLRKISFEDVVRYTCMTTGLKYSYDDSAIIISDGSLPSGAMQTRSYSVQPGAFPAKRTRPRPEKIKWNDDEDN